jgi:hypothetical protein
MHTAYSLPGPAYISTHHQTSPCISTPSDTTRSCQR